MRDGTLLAADLYVPDRDAGLDGLPASPLPVVLDYIPYRKDEVDPAAMRHYLELPRHGYVLARVDIRGTGGSGGHAIDEYVAQEQLDGYDAIEWLAAQPWCDGHVNMMGISYGGFTALQVATLQPPHLTSIVAGRLHRRSLHRRLPLSRRAAAAVLRPRLVRHADDRLERDADRPDVRRGRGAATVWRRHVDEDEPYLLEWLRHQVDGPYWRQGSVADVVERIACPAFLIGGWRDGYPNPPTRLFERLRGPRKLLIGPWDHRYPDAAVPGPRIDHLVEVVRWLDHWCLDRDTGVMAEPAVALYVQETGTDHARPTRHPGPLAIGGGLAAGGRLGADASSRAGRDAAGRAGAADAVDDAASDERHGPRAGRSARRHDGRPVVGRRAVRAMPGDQRPDEARSLVYTAAPLAEPLTILGRARAILHVVPGAEVAALAVSLSDVAPDGASHLVAKGMLNGTRRTSLTDARAARPGHGPRARDRHRRDRPGDSRRVIGSGCRSPPPTGRTSGRRRRSRPSTCAAARPRRRGSSCRSSRTRGPCPRRPSSPPRSPPAPPRDSTRRRHGSSPTTSRLGHRPRRSGSITSHTTPDGARIERDAGCVCELDPARPGRRDRARLAPLLERRATGIARRVARRSSSPAAPIPSTSRSISRSPSTASSRPPAAGTSTSRGSCCDRHHKEVDPWARPLPR